MIWLLTNGYAQDVDDAPVEMHPSHRFGYYPPKRYHLSMNSKYWLLGGSLTLRLSGSCIWLSIRFLIRMEKFQYENSPEKSAMLSTMFSAKEV